MKFRNRAAMPSRPLCLISFLSLEDVLLDCQHATKLTQSAKKCRIYFNKVKVIPPLDGGEPKVGPLPANGMKPLLGGQFLEFGLEFSALGRRGQ